MASSRSLGVLTIDMVLKTVGLTQGAERAERELDKRTKRVSQKAEQLGKALGTGIAVAGSAAAAAMALFVRNTIEAERVQAQLVSRLNDTGGVAMRSLQQLNDHAEKLQSLTTFDDEAIGGVQAMLLTFKDIRDIRFDKATEAVLDLSTAMGTDLNSAALQIGKALNDPVAGLTALSRAGVQFSEDQKKVIKALVEAGDKAKAQDIILAELEGQMGTAAEAARNTLGGALQGLGNAFDNLLEGDTGDDGLRASVDAVNSLTDALNDPDVKRGVENVVSGIASIAAEAAEGVGAIQRLISQHNTLFGIMDKRGSGAALSSYSDEELQNTIALLGRGKARAQASGDLAQAAKLQAEITALIRENTRRLRGGAAEALPMKFSPEYERASLMFNPNPKPKPEGTTQPTGRSGKSDVQRQAEEAAKAAKEAADAQARWHGTILDMEATLAGPLAEANRQYERNVHEITSEYQAGNVALSDYARALEVYTKQRDAEVAAINARKGPAQEMLEDVQHEAILLGKTADEQERLNAARHLGADANTDAGRAALSALEGLQKQKRAIGDQIYLMDAARNSAKGFFTDIYEGASAWDAAKNALDRFADALFDLAASKVIEQLFGQMGSTQSGSSGNWLTQLIGAFAGAFGGSPGAASGGWRSAHSMFEVNERGLEMATVRGRDYLLTGGNPVEITPNHKMGGAGGVTVQQNFYNPRMYDRRSDSQRAAESAQRLKQGVRFA